MAVTWFIVDRVGLGLAELGALDAAAWTPSPGPFLASCVVLLAAYLLSGAIWGRIVADLGGPELPAGTSVQLFMIANLGRYVPGKVWQIAGLAALGKSRGVPAKTGTAAAVLGQGIALVAASAIGAAAFFDASSTVGWIGPAAAIGVASLLVLLAIPSVFGAFAGLWFRVARTEPPESFHSGHGLRWLALYAVNWAMYAFAFWILCVSLGHTSALLPVASAFAAAYVLGYVMLFAPAGLGPREGFLIAFLTPHFGPAPSGVIAIVARLWTTVVEIVPAGLFWSRFVAAPVGGAEAGEGADG